MKIKATVCELRHEPAEFEADWGRLAEHLREESSDLVVLPEMTFAPWFAAAREFDPAVWRSAVAAHERWMGRLEELAPAAVLGSRPADTGGRRINQGFLWEPGAGDRAVHSKHYLPEEESFWEASWYGRGNGGFKPFPCGEARLGMLICTDLWFLEHARAYGRSGVHLLVLPRATARETLEKWLCGGRVAGVVSGAFVLSSNRSCAAGGAINLGGQGWIAGPDGQVLGLTTPARPFLTVELDLDEAERAKSTYPRYVRE